VILVDTSVWADHIDRGVAALASLLETGQVLTHPFVIGELAVGNLRRREPVLRNLHSLPRAVVATDAETLLSIEQFRLYGAGIGYVDAHLLASTRISPGASLWTFDRRLHDAAIRLEVVYELEG
jgi:predicted nucleic acid-binding protein